MKIIKVFFSLSILTIFIATLSGCVTTKMSQPLPKTQRIAITSTMGNVMEKDKVGLIALTDKKEKIELKNISVDNFISKDISKMLKKNGYKNVTIISNPSKEFLEFSFLDSKDPIRKEMKERNINLWIKIEPSSVPFSGDRDSPRNPVGYGLANLSTILSSHYLLYGAYMIRAYSYPSIKQVLFNEENVTERLKNYPPKPNDTKSSPTIEQLVTDFIKQKLTPSITNTVRNGMDLD